MFIVLQRVYDARHARRLTPSGAELTEWLEGARTGVHAADQLGGLNTRPFKDIKRFSTTVHLLERYTPGEWERRSRVPGVAPQTTKRY